MIYVITGIMKSKEKVEVRNSNDMKTVIGIWSVDKIIKLILDDEMIITSIFKDKSWRNGERVSVINEEDKTFIRTKPDQFLSNNLGELPEISVS